MRKKVLIGVGAFIAVLVAAALIVPHLIDINHYHDQIQAQLQSKLGRKVSLGKMSFSLFPPSFSVEHAVIGEDPGFNTGQPFATADKLSVDVEFWPLFAKQVEINSLRMEQPHIELVKNVQGVWNFSTLGQTGKSKAGQKTPAAPSKDKKDEATPGLSPPNVEIIDGQVAITDVEKHQARAVYDHIDLKLSDFEEDSHFSLKATAHLPGEGRQAIYLEGKGGPLQPSAFIKTNFEGKLKLEQVSVSGVEKFLNVEALSGMEAVVSGDAKVKNAGGKVSSAGALKLENLNVHKVSVNYPITVDYDISDDLNSDVLQIQHAEIKLGPSPVTVAGMINNKPTPAQVDLKITASNTSIAEAARLASAFGVAFNQGMDVNGLVTANIQARGETSKLSLNGQLAARDLVISGKGLPQPVKVNAIEVWLTPDVIRSNDFTASTGSTSMTANFALSQYSGANTSIAASLRAANAQLGEALNIAKAYGVSAVEGITGEGNLSLDVKAQGPTQNLSALNFNGHGKLQNASAKIPAFTKPIQVRNSDITFSQNSVTLDKVNVAVGQTNATGTLTLKDFADPQVQFTLNADKFNVEEWQRLMASAPGEPAQQAGDFWRIVPAARAERGAHAEPSLFSRMTGSGTVNVGAAQYNDLLMNNAHANVTLDHGLVTLNPVTSDLYGGKQTGSVSIDTRPALTVYTVNLKTDKVDANRLLSSVSSIKKTLYGLLTSNVNASFSASSADAIARSLNGQVGLNVANGKLANLDLLHELAAVGKFAGIGAPKGFTNIVQLSGNFDVRNGVAQTNNLKAVIDGGTIAGSGTINLASETLNMHVTTVLTKAMSQKVGGNKIGGFMSTALANNQGELVMPVLVTGTFSRPVVAPDVQQIAQLKLQNLLPTSKNPAAGITDIMGTLMGNQQQQQNASGDKSGQQQPSNPLGDLMQQVLKKKNDQKKKP